MNTEVIGTAKLRHVTRKSLLELKSILCVEGFNGEFIAVIVPYEYFLEMQDTIIKANATIEFVELKLERIALDKVTVGDPNV